MYYLFCSIFLLRRSHNVLVLVLKEKRQDEFIYHQEQHKKYCFFHHDSVILGECFVTIQARFLFWFVDPLSQFVTVQYVYHLFCESIIYLTKNNCAIWICCSTYLCYCFLDIFSLLNIVTFGRTILVTVVLAQWFALAKIKLVHNLEGFYFLVVHN